MAINIIVETGSIVAGANSYGSVADADAYFSDRNNTTWAALDAVTVKPSLLIQASDYMLQSFRTRWQGYRVSILQSLDWPRFQVLNWGAPGQYGPAPYYYPPNFIPNEIKWAQFELAYRASQGSLAPDIEPVQSSLQLGSLKISYDTEYSPITTFRAVDLLLKPFLRNFGTSASVGRL